ncbi:PPK2 family polyphosphate kinase [Tellurirhabdus rosea]|uniref:PPK2 family polyphosphate kinase n=1 Tax=Tellurirhabdus rosea TaxID=2674997 RepID=UPI00225483BA|nr:PPK2 family polyphosphate kinase [Tellurirhabdus rosea]
MNTYETKLLLDVDRFRQDGSDTFVLKEADTKIPDLYESDDQYDALLHSLTDELDELQQRMFAHNRYGLLAIFQAMDAAGKDSTIQKVFSGVNPLGLRVYSFKRPSEQELDHDFLWRCLVNLPERGTIGIFNRSYYEEVLAVKVHPDLLTEKQRLPEDLLEKPEKIWDHRYEDIRHIEKYLHRNGFPVVKFFLNISKKEQGKRLIKRIENPAKNWKFDDQDVVERGFWKEYMKAYEETINETATEHAPWYVVPADDKKNMRLIVAKILVEELKKLKFRYPEVNARQRKTLQQLKEVIEKQDKD